MLYLFVGRLGNLSLAGVDSMRPKEGWWRSLSIHKLHCFRKVYCHEIRVALA